MMVMQGAWRALDVLGLIASHVRKLAGAKTLATPLDLRNPAPAAQPASRPP